jgi:Na+/melibiose symporter-like transporter
MQIGTSIFLIALGAILKFAVDTTTEGFNIQTAGTILIVIGIIGLVISLFWMTLWSGRRERVAERPVVRERDVY